MNISQLLVCSFLFISILSPFSVQAQINPPLTPEPFPYSDRYPVQIEVSTPADMATLYQANIDIVTISPQNTGEPISVVLAYVNDAEYQAVAAAGLKLTIVPNLAYRAFLAYGPGSNAPNAWPTYEQFVSRLQAIATTYPAISSLHVIGQTVQHRNLYCLELTDNPGTEEDEPEFRFDSTMHGIEAVGTEMILRLAELLTASYGTDTTLTHLVNEMDIWLCPMHNPDGYTLGTYYNANNVNLNRDFPDPITDPVDSIVDREPETQAYMLLTYAHNFVMGANYHTGATVVNLPWDSTTNASPDHALYDYLGHGYANRNLDILNGGVWVNGGYQSVVIGGQWYVIHGGMQDWAYNWHGEHHITIEISEYQPPAYETMNTYWSHNRDAMFWWMEHALSGARGLVRDSQTGAPLDATITVTQSSIPGYNPLPIQTDPAIGDFHRLLLAGSYTLRTEAQCYQPATQTVTITNNEAAAVTVNFDLQPSTDNLLSGRVTEAGTDLPLAATIGIVDSPIQGVSDPYTGDYQLGRCPGTYRVRVSAPLHQTVERQVNLTSNRVEDFSLPLQACAILIDDDLGQTYEAYYQNALASAGIAYQTWSVASLGSPALFDLQQYPVVVWETGNDSSTTLTDTDQANLDTYLNSGGRLLLSGQNIAYDIQGSSFLTNTLHTSFINNGNTSNNIVNGLDFLTGLSGGLTGTSGANNQNSPDEIGALTGAVPIWKYNNTTKIAGTTHSNSEYSAAFFAFGFEGINSPTTRRQVLESTFTFLGGCPEFDIDVTQPQPSQMIAGSQVELFVRVANHGPQPVANVEVRDVLADVFENPSWVCIPSAGAECAEMAGSGDITSSVNLPVGGFATFIVTINIAPSANGSYEHTVQAIPPPGSPEYYLINNTSTIEVSVTPIAISPRIYFPLIYQT